MMPTMDFPAAMRQVINGFGVKRISWDDPETYVDATDGFLILHQGLKNDAWMISTLDLEADDWIIAEAE